VSVRVELVEAIPGGTANCEIPSTGRRTCRSLLITCGHLYERSATFSIVLSLSNLSTHLERSSRMLRAALEEYETATKLPFALSQSKRSVDSSAMPDQRRIAAVYGSELHVAPALLEIGGGVALPPIPQTHSASTDLAQCDIFSSIMPAVCNAPSTQPCASE
jgi:hypothetical protein